MKIYSVYAQEFKPYGKILQNYDTQPLISAMRTISMPESGTVYEPSISALEKSGIFDAMQDRAYGGMPIQIGMCWGYNTKLNCLEYHRDSEVNVGETDFVLLLAKEDEIEHGKLDTAKVKAFRVPAGVAVALGGCDKHARAIKVLCDERFGRFRTEVSEEYDEGIAVRGLDVGDGPEHVGFVLDGDGTFVHAALAGFGDVRAAHLGERAREAVTGDGDEAELDIGDVFKHDTFPP